MKKQNQTQQDQPEISDAKLNKILNELKEVGDEDMKDLTLDMLSEEDLQHIKELAKERESQKENT
jgi:hypothetical protein